MTVRLTGATGLGSLPGTDATEAARLVAGELPDLPHLAELPARGPAADVIGRMFAILADLPGEVAPSGWRLTARPGLDARRAKDLLARDVEAFTAAAAGASVVKLQLAGPWTLAAAVELPNGNRVLTDHGAVRAIRESLIEGLGGYVAGVRRELGDTAIAVQVDEPGLAAVLGGRVPTASGFGTIAAVGEQEAQAALAEVAAAVTALGCLPLVHPCDPMSPLGLLRRSGFEAVSVDLTRAALTSTTIDAVGELLDSGAVLLAGVVPAIDPATPATRVQLAAPLLTLWRALALDNGELAAKVVVTPSCGMAGASAGWARTAMEHAREIGRALLDPPDSWA